MIQLHRKGIHFMKKNIFLSFCFVLAILILCSCGTGSLDVNDPVTQTAGSTKNTAATFTFASTAPPPETSTTAETTSVTTTEDTTTATTEEPATTTEEPATTTKKPTTSTQKPTEKQNNPQIVWITPSGKRYHYISTCGGKNSYSVSIDHVGNRTPCQKCAK